MKFCFVEPRVGFSWIALGIKTCLAQPLAMSGVFLIFLVSGSLLSLLPLVGTVIFLVLVPALTVGLMSASAVAAGGRFPMPSVLLTVFRTDPARIKPMVVLGAMYAVAMLLVMLIGTFQNGLFAQGIWGQSSGGAAPDDMRLVLDTPGLLLGLLAYAPVLIAFWHAPALVWHGVSPWKSLFFSVAACWYNKGAMLLYTLGWLGLLALVLTAVGLIAGALGGSGAIGWLLFPCVLMVMTAFHTSIYFTFRDSFMADGPVQGSPSVF